ncbi:SpoIIE family protein phosphatase [Dethiothermospora halolimnae]|uniref:SpoIIE family protein phosphatase n=1 Tax=Dethiothermospora halolimnae TaxID=3114390 RepID=UPI003CCC2390
MGYFIDVAYDSLNKFGEELCGDKVEIIKNKDEVILVMSDGLGSGVKANILATLTTKIAATMLREGSSIGETVDTVVNTLPVCNVRKLAYSTFTIMKIKNNGDVYIVEYDNPPIFFIRDNKVVNLEKREFIINDKLIKESNFRLKKGDTLTAVSDGVIHAGVGGILNLGWQWENVAEYLERISSLEKSAKYITKSLAEVCNNFYINKPGDDTTVVSVKLREPEVVNLFTGPPTDESKDPWVVKQLMKGNGKKVVCGGTAANIVSRELKEEIIVNLDYIDKEVPPTAKIKGIDLVTEGVLTLSKAVEKLKGFTGSDINGNITLLGGKDGASQLVKLLVEDCTHLNLYVGKAVNPAHQNPDFPVDLSIKLKIVSDLIRLIRSLGKDVNVIYIN